jgi:hypothetical protein
MCPGAGTGFGRNSRGRLPEGDLFFIFWIFAPGGPGGSPHMPLHERQPLAHAADEQHAILAGGPGFGGVEAGFERVPVAFRRAAPVGSRRRHPAAGGRARDAGAGPRARYRSIVRACSVTSLENLIATAMAVSRMW